MRKKMGTKKPPYRRRYRKKAAINKFIAAPPRYMNALLTWNGTVQFNTTGTTVPQVIIMQPNNLYDISTSISGTQQPYLRDQLFGLYGNARCLKWSVKVSFIPFDSQKPVDVVLGVVQNGTADSDINLAKQRKWARSTILNNGQGRNSLSLSLTSDTCLGRKRGYCLSDDVAIQTLGLDNIGDSARNYLQLAVRDIMGTIAGGSLGIANVNVKQWARFEDPLEQAGS